MTTAASLDSARLRWTFIGLTGAVVAAISALLAPSRDGLTIYAAGETAPAVVESFVRATGVPVALVRLSTGPLLARIAAEGTRPGWTLAWFDGDMAAAGLDGAGLLAHGTTPAAQWTPVGRSLVPANGAWTPVAFSVANMSVTLNRPAGSTSDASVLGMADPALSGPAYLQVTALLIAAGGWPSGRVALQRLGAHGLSIAPTSPNVVAQLRDGRIGRALLQSNTAYLLASRDAHVKYRCRKPPMYYRASSSRPPALAVSIASTPRVSCASPPPTRHRVTASPVVALMPMHGPPSLPAP